MPEETKSPPPGTAGEPKGPAQTGTAQSAAAKSTTESTSEKPPAAAKPAGPVAVPWASPLVTKLKTRYGSGVSEAITYLGQNCLVLDSSIAHEILRILSQEE